MKILEKMIPGYNNILTLATSSMGFGVNTNLNYSRTPTEPKENHQSDQPSHQEVLPPSTDERLAVGGRPKPSKKDPIGEEEDGHKTMNLHPKIPTNGVEGIGDIAIAAVGGGVTYMLFSSSRLLPKIDERSRMARRGSDSRSRGE